ncbi:MAG: YciI family protein [Chitinophagaceae bacterium]
MRKYWFVLLKAGSNRTQDSATAAKIQTEHLNNIDRLYYEGKIKVAGPFGEKGDWKGIFIFDAETKEEVEKLLQSDLAISSGRLTYEIKPWYTAPMGSFVPGKPKKEKN